MMSKIIGGRVAINKHDHLVESNTRTRSRNSVKLWQLSARTLACVQELVFSKNDPGLEWDERWTDRKNRWTIWLVYERAHSTPRVIILKRSSNTYQARQASQGVLFKLFRLYFPSSHNLYLDEVIRIVSVQDLGPGKSPPVSDHPSSVAWIYLYLMQN